MTTIANIQLFIAQALPHGDEKDSQAIIALWKQMQTFFNARSFVASDALNGKARTYQVSLDASSMVAMMEKARAQSKSFSAHLKAHMADPHHATDATLKIALTSADHTLEEGESYQVATIFLQQLVLAANLVLPGSIQILDARFIGPAAHRYETQHFDSRIMYGALLASRMNNWPTLQQQDLDSVWSWLDKCETSYAHTALKRINKVLYTMLKVAEQRHEYGARTVLLITYQLEMLLDSRNTTPGVIRRRTRMVLGQIAEPADCLSELFQVRNSLFLADQPVHRPPLIAHNTAAALRELTGQHNTAIEAGTALVLALLQDLIAHGSQAYDFDEIMSRV